MHLNNHRKQAFGIVFGFHYICRKIRPNEKLSDKYLFIYFLYRLFGTGNTAVPEAADVGPPGEKITGNDPGQSSHPESASFE